MKLLKALRKHSLGILTNIDRLSTETKDSLDAYMRIHDMYLEDFKLDFQGLSQRATILLDNETKEQQPPKNAKSESL